MKPELTEAEYLQQEEEKPSGAVLWIAASGLAWLFVFAIVMGAAALGGK